MMGVILNKYVSLISLICNTSPDTVRLMLQSPVSFLFILKLNTVTNFRY
jgi:hypothetical protein